MWGCRRVLDKAWDLKLSVALWLYKTILLPKLLYVAIVWWPRGKVKAMNLDQRSSRDHYLRVSVGTMKLTSIEVLEVALSVTSFDFRIMHVAEDTTCRLFC